MAEQELCVFFEFEPGRVNKSDPLGSKRMLEDRAADSKKAKVQDAYEQYFDSLDQKLIRQVPLKVSFY